jgi:hypothetical protein
MAMSKERKAALAQGRRESRAIKRYLEALGNRRPGRPVTTESLESRISRIDDKLRDENDPLKKVDLLQQRIDAAEALKRISATEDIQTLEEGFVDSARTYSERKGITYSAWREAGVPAEILRKAGVGRAG